MRKLSLMAGVAFLAAGAACWAGGANDKDKEKLQGTWTLTSIAYDGKAIPLPAGKTVTLTFTGDKVAFKEDGDKAAQDGTFKLDASKNPKHIDLNKGGAAKEDDKAIYSLDGDMLKICLGGKLSGDGKAERPAAFDSPMTILMVFKRQAK